MATYSRILIPIDFSELSQEALRQACDLARRFDAELHLVHVLETWLEAPRLSADSRPRFNELLAEQQARAKRSLDELPDPRLGPKLAVRRVLTGNAAREIVKYADASGIDLIVLGTHGRTGMSHWMMGSVAEKVVRLAPCPVLVVRPPHMTSKPHTAGRVA